MISKRPDRSSRRRLMIMLRHTWQIAIGACFLITGLVGTGLYVASRPTTLTIALGPATGEDTRVVQAIAQQFARDRASIRLHPVLKDGPIEAAHAIESGEADLAIVRRDLAYPKTGLAVAVLRENMVVFIVPAAGSVAKGPKAPSGNKTRTRKAEKIEKIEDVVGHRIGVVGRSNANIDVLNAILKQYQIPSDKVTIVPLSADDVATALRMNPVDVIFAAGPETSQFIADAIAASSNGKAAPEFLSVGASEAIASRLPVYESTEIKAGSFAGKTALPKDDVDTISFKHYIVARRSLPENTAADFTRLLFGVRQGLAADYPVLAKMEKPDTDRDAAVQAHPGAAAYIDDDQKTFFDRYSDFLYWGLMLMSGLGSVAAWLISYTKADDRVRRLKVLDHLLCIVKTARTAESLDQLDKLRSEVDDILTRTVRQAERENFQDSGMTAFSLAIDQAQRAISDRRSVLTARDAAVEHESAPADARREAPAEAGSAEVMPLRAFKAAGDSG